MKMMKKLMALVLVLALAAALTGCASGDYKKAVAALESGDYETAGAMFKALGDYEDSAAQAAECDYQLAVTEKAQGLNRQARELFAALGDYKDSAALLSEIDSLLIREKLVGAWLADSVDMSQKIADDIGYSMGEDADIFLKYCPVEDFFIVMQAEFAEDGSVSTCVEQGSFDKALEGYLTSVRSGFGDYLMAAVEEAIIAEGITMEDLEQLLGEAATPESLALFFYEVPLDELVDGILDDADIDLSSMAFSGTWEVKNGSVLVTLDGKTEYADFDLNADRLTFTGEGLPEQPAYYPMSFHRA